MKGIKKNMMKKEEKIEDKGRNTLCEEQKEKKIYEKQKDEHDKKKK